MGTNPGDPIEATKVILRAEFDCFSIADARRLIRSIDALCHDLEVKSKSLDGAPLQIIEDEMRHLYGLSTRLMAIIRQNDGAP